MSAPALANGALADIAPSTLTQMDTTVKAGAIVVALFVVAFAFLYFRIWSGPKKRK
ncbi:MAG: hypothetical protein ACHREM_08325 [Polyangiales bacterium]